MRRACYFVYLKQLIFRRRTLSGLRGRDELEANTVENTAKVSASVVIAKHESQGLHEEDLGAWAAVRHQGCSRNFHDESFSTVWQCQRYRSKETEHVSSPGGSSEPVAID